MNNSDNFEYGYLVFNKELFFDSEKGVYICPICNRACVNENSFSSHLVRAHFTGQNVKLLRESWYNQHPKFCTVCGKTISMTQALMGNKFCSHSCSAKSSNSNRDDSWKQKWNQTFHTNHPPMSALMYPPNSQKPIVRIPIYKSNNPHKISYYRCKGYCKVCGAVVGECKYPNICAHRQLIYNVLVKYFTFDANTLGSEDAIVEYERVRELIRSEYWDNKLSGKAIIEKYNYPIHYANFNKLMKSLNIPMRDYQQANIEAIKNGRACIGVCQKFKHGWHTDWQGNKWFYRSSYEEKQMNEYDIMQIQYEVETLKIQYFDTTRQIWRNAIPDFYLPDTNEIIEVKSSYTYDEQNMKDKFKSYIELGYKPKLILDFKEKQLNLLS